MLSELLPKFGCLNAAVVLHRSMLSNIMRMPMEFFDRTPTGRILARISRDVEIVDGALPRNIDSVTFFTFQVNARTNLTVTRVLHLPRLTKPRSFQNHPAIARFINSVKDTLCTITISIKNSIYTKKIIFPSTELSFPICSQFPNQFSRIIESRCISWIAQTFRLKLNSSFYVEHDRE